MTYGIGIREHDQEGRVITMEFPSFIVVCCYTPNSGKKLERVKYRVEKWDVDFHKYVTDLEEKGKAVIVTGDLNCSF